MMVKRDCDCDCDQCHLPSALGNHHPGHDGYHADHGDDDGDGDGDKCNLIII